MATPTKARTFYPTTSTDDQTFTGEATIRAFEETNPASNVTTRAQWTATGAQTRTFIPFATTTTNSDTSQNNGWAFENSTTDALLSTATDKRIIPAGVWQFNLNVVKTATPLLSTAASCIATVRMYRVASGGGTRTSLFTADSANITASGIVTINSAPQPAITLEAGEVMMMGITIVSAAFSAVVLGGATTMNLDLDIRNTSLVVPAPGIRTASTRSYDTFGKGAATRVVMPMLSRNTNGLGSIAYTKAVIASKSFTLGGIGSITRNLAVTQMRNTNGLGSIAYTKAVIASKSFTLNGLGVITRQISPAISRNVNGLGSVTYTKSVISSKSFTLNGLGSIAYTKSVQAQRIFSLIGIGTATHNKNVDQTRNVNGLGAISYTKSVIASKSFTLNGLGFAQRQGLIIIMLERTVDGLGKATESRSVQAQRTFSLTGVGKLLTTGPNATTITIPIDEIPTEGGGGNTFIYPVFNVFD